jgi:hypothetical protein
MGAIDYERFYRVLTRCGEIAREHGMKASVVWGYINVLKPAAETFRSAHHEVTNAEASFKKEAGEALSALSTLDAPYQKTRSVVLAFAPGTALPETLKGQRSDTEKLNAIETLLDELDDHAGEAWADEEAQSAFGQQAAGTVKELNEAIAANASLAEAGDRRAQAYGPAYERYLRFKRVVRDELGAKSKQYKRIHLRGLMAAEDEDEGGEGQGR